MTDKNFLLGKGEQLTKDILPARRRVEKAYPYSFDETRTRLAPMISKTVDAVKKLPFEACAGGKGLITLTMNPGFLAKSYFPATLFNNLSLNAVGSRRKTIVPQKRTGSGSPKETMTTEFFMMGMRENIEKWNTIFETTDQDSRSGKELTTIEEISTPSAESKLIGKFADNEVVKLEVVLHTNEIDGEETIFPELRNYLKGLSLYETFEKRFYVNGLAFTTIEAPSELILDVSKFTAIRAIRRMPRLRELRPMLRSRKLGEKLTKFPESSAVNKDVKAVIFDGGIPSNHPLTNYVTIKEPKGIGTPSPDGLEHGVKVTSAFLFGSIDTTVELPRPNCQVDHYRVLDTNSTSHEADLLDVLARIKKVLSTEKYDLVNLSIGPSIPVTDDEIHVWTAVLDDLIAKNNFLMGIAVGNTGDSNSDYGLNRIQIPSDCINAIAVGACDSMKQDWKRASYSSVGPGRNPGYVKPDLVAFGGSATEPFLALCSNYPSRISESEGTSFSTPLALKIASGILAYYDRKISTLATRTLLVHTSENNSIDKSEVGWGRIPNNITDIVVCNDKSVKVLYQGKISPSKYQRVFIPMIENEIKGLVRIKATICYQSESDPSFPDTYTQAGLELTFRPHDEKFSGESQIHPKSKPFFGKSSPGLTEIKLRREAWKWENCMKEERNFQGKSLHNPCFDIHYNSRHGGRNFRHEMSLDYAMVISVETGNDRDFYNKIRQKYATQLEVLTPVVELPVNV